MRMLANSLKFDVFERRNGNQILQSFVLKKRGDFVGCQAILYNHSLLAKHGCPAGLQYKDPARKFTATVKVTILVVLRCTGLFYLFVCSYMYFSYLCSVSKGSAGRFEKLKHSLWAEHFLFFYFDFFLETRVETRQKTHGTEIISMFLSLAICVETSLQLPRKECYARMTWTEIWFTG